MAVIGQITINAAMHTAKLSQGVTRAKGQLKGLETAANSTRNAFGGLAGAVAGAVGVGSITGFLTMGAKVAADAEQAKISFETILGSAEEASNLMAGLKDFAADTPFELPELIRAAKSLAAFGYTGRQVIPTLRRIGDLAAGVGVGVGELAEIFGKAKVQGRLFMEDINQLSGRGINIQKELAKQFGVTGEEVRELVSSGKVNFENLEAALVSMTDKGGAFFNLMEKLSESMGGKWSTLKDNFSALAAEIFLAANRALQLDKILTSSSGGAESATETLPLVVEGTLQSLLFTVNALQDTMLAIAAHNAKFAELFGSDPHFTEAYIQASQELREGAGQRLDRIKAIGGELLGGQRGSAQQELEELKKKAEQQLEELKSANRELRRMNQSGPAIPAVNL